MKKFISLCVIFALFVIMLTGCSFTETIDCLTAPELVVSGDKVYYNGNAYVDFDDYKIDYADPMYSPKGTAINPNPIGRVGYRAFGYILWEDEFGDTFLKFGGWAAGVFVKEGYQFPDPLTLEVEKIYIAGRYTIYEDVENTESLYLYDFLDTSVFVAKESGIENEISYEYHPWIEIDISTSQYLELDDQRLFLHDGSFYYRIIAHDKNYKFKDEYQGAIYEAVEKYKAIHMNDT